MLYSLFLYVFKTLSTYEVFSWFRIIINSLVSHGLTVDLSIFMNYGRTNVM